MIIDRWQRNTLNGQNISAQGNALGKQESPPAPCKGSSKQYHKDLTNNWLTKHKHMKTLKFTALLLIISVLGAQAQEVWSLQDCIDHALENNLEIRHQLLEETRARHDLNQSYANALPTLNLGTQASFNFGRSIDEVTNEFFTERIASQSMAANSSLNLFAGFRNINTIRYHTRARLPCVTTPKTSKTH